MLEKSEINASSGLMGHLACMQAKHFYISHSGFTLLLLSSELHACGLVYNVHVDRQIRRWICAMINIFFLTCCSIWKELMVCLGGAVASRLVCLTIDQVLRVPVLARDITFSIITAQNLAYSLANFH